MKKLLILLIAFPVSVFSQDFHFSQIEQSMAMINPAVTSTFSGFERISLQHRDQWLGAGTQFMTSMGMMEFSIGKQPRKTSAYSGIGVYFVNDIGGDSKFSIKTGGFTASGVLPLSKAHSVSAGIQVGYSNRSADFSRLTFYNQWDGTQFDPNIDANEVNGVSSFSHLDAGIGISYSYNKENENTLSASELSFQGGFSMQHINRPTLRYNSLVDDKLPIKLCLHTNVRYGLSPESNLELSAAQFIQAKNYETIAGLFYRLRMKSASRVTSFVSDQYFVIGSYFRSTGAIIPSFYIDLGGFTIGVSYDYEVGKIASMYRQSVEVSMKINFGKKSIFESSKMR